MHYDNYHINKYMYELDWKRASVHRQTLFPLTLSEKFYYVSVSDFPLSWSVVISTLANKTE